ncbi:hypothetical protein [Bosea thiooxidans]
MTDGDAPGRLDERAAAIIRAELERILSSDGFRAAPQLSSFLSFIVERAVEGRASELKGYTIAVEALGRPADFNPQIDPIVRVEAGRLRRALAQYYAGEGRADPVQLSMPVGGYAPVFAFSDAAACPTGSATPADERSGEAAAAPETGPRAAAARRGPMVALAAFGIALVGLAAWYLWPSDTPFEGASRKVAPELAGRVQPAAIHAPQLLRVAITIPSPPADPKLADLLRRFSNLLVDAMARFDDIVTIKAPPPGSTGGEDIDYAFEMSLQATDSEVEGLGRLRSVRDGRIVWTASTGRAPVGGLAEAELAERARRLATRLTEPFGIIPADARQAPPSPASRCILRAFDLRRTMLAEDDLAARACLEQLVEQDPGFYPAWAHLAVLELGESGETDLRDKSKLDRSLAAALAAIRLAPSGARAYQAMMKVLLLRGAVDEAIQMGREALARNPYDPDIMADLGALFVRRGRPAEGLPLLERAIALSVGRPARYDFYAFLGSYLSGSAKGGEAYAATLAADHTPLSLLGRALLAASEGDQQKLSTAVSELTERAPLFGSDPRGYLLRRGFSEEVVTRLLAALGLAGR